MRYNKNNGNFEKPCNVPDIKIKNYATSIEGDIPKSESSFFHFPYNTKDFKKNENMPVGNDEEKLKLVMNAAMDAIICINTSGEIIFWNPQAAAIFGWTEKEALGYQLAELIIPQQYRKRHIEGMAHYLKTGEGPALNKLMELSAVKRSGQEFPIELTIMPIRQQTEEFFCAFIRDITERKKSEAALKKAYEEKNIILERIDDGFFATDENSVITFWNTRAEILLEAKREDVIGKNLHELFKNQSSMAFYNHYQKAIKENTTIHFEEYSTRTNKWFAVSAFASVNGLSVYFKDVTENKAAEEKIKESELRYKSIIDQATDAICIADASMKILDVNPYCCQMLGYTKDEFLLLSVADLFLPEDLIVNPFKITALKSGNVIRNERRFKKKDGSLIEVEMSGRILEDGRFIVFGHDIAERKKAENKLRESELRYRSLNEQATDTICMLDSNFRFIDVNNSGCQMFGYSKEEVLQMHMAELLFEEDLNTNPIRIDDLKAGEAISNERRIKRKDGSAILVELSSKMLEDGSIIIFGRDISARKESERLLRESEAKYRSFFESSMDGILITVTDGAILSANPAACEIFKMTEQEICTAGRMGIVDLTDPRVYTLLDERKRTGKVKGEITLIRKDGSKFEAELTSAVFTDSYGQERTSMIVRDITERKIAEDRVKESELRYRTLNEQATDAICITDASMRFININPYGCEIFGYTEEEVLQLSLSDILFSEDLADNPLKVSELKLGETTRNERRLKRKDGTAVDMEVSTRLLEDGRMIMFGHDVSESKKAAQLIIESEAKYRTLFEQNMAGVYQTTANGVILNCNNAFAKMLKYDSPAELLEINASALYFSPEERNAFADNAINNKNLNNYESVLKCKDGSPLHFIENISVRKNEITGEIFFDGIMIDITEKKQAELRLKEINERYNLISLATNDMVWDWDLLTGNVYRNKEGWKKIFRTGDKEIESETIQDWDNRIHPDDFEAVKKIEREIPHSDKDFFEVECRVLRDDGTYAYIHDRGYIMRNEQGVAYRLMGATQDITARKQAELQVAKSELRFRSLVQNSSDIICIFNDRGYFLYSSPAIRKVLGFEPEEIIEKNAFAFLHPDDVNPLKDYLSQPKPDMNREMPLLRFKNNRGEWKWIESKVTNMCDNPEVAGYVFNCRDITERKIAEAEIEKLSFIARETGNAVIITNPEGEIVWVNEGFTKITEFELEEAMGRKPGDFLQGEETSLAVVKYMRKKLKQAVPFQCDIINYSKSGRKYWLRIQCQPQFDESGNLKYFFAIETDITKEKEAEEILKASEERYRYLFNNNPVSIIIWDLETLQVLEVNEAAVALYEYSRKEFINKNILELREEKYYQNIKEFAAKALIENDFISVKNWMHIKKSGEEICLNISSHKIHFNGKPAMLALATDITEKLKLQNDLEKERLLKQQEITKAVISAQESERQELGGELHDNVNQILAGSLLYMGLAKKELKIAHPYLNETEILINTAIEEIRNLSHSLIAPSMHESEFLDALKNIIEVTQKTSGINICLYAGQFDENSISDKLKLTIYRIVQEQLNNILKHAAAQNVVVQLSKDNEKTLLSIKDDGAGFDTSQKAKGVGLLNIKTRASLFNGELFIISSPGNGCELRILFDSI